MSGDPLRNLSRYDDGFGALVPITDRWCPGCGYPLHPGLTEQTHPLCAPHD